MRHPAWPAAAWTALWLLLTAVALAARPVLPIDETRYLAVAWEMWRGGDYLVPHLNGAAYSHKPPLLFWLITAGWGVFGVNEWWARLVAPLFALANLFLTAALGRRLWPGNAAIGPAAALLLIGGLYWALYGTLIMFDMVLACFTLVGLLGMVAAWRGRRAGFVLLALGIGLGVLTKGPAILLHLLPAALLAPVWGPRLASAEGPAPPFGGWRRWYLGILAALAAGAALALAWAVPAGIAGGAAYRDAIFWGQSAGRVVESFAHGRPFWWYLAILPGIVLPWLLWPPLWRAARGLGWALDDGGVRFCLSWFVPALVIFSLISGKQPHYLLPIVPALALIGGFMLGGGRETAAAPLGTGARDQVIPGLFTAAMGAALLAVPLAVGRGTLPAWFDAVTPAWAALPIAAGLLAMVKAPAWLHGRLAQVAGLSAALIVGVTLGGRPVLVRAYDLKPLATRLAGWERQGIPLANYGKYHGQFQFLGRLGKPLAVLGDGPDAVKAWAARHPDGKVIAYYRARPAGHPAFVQPYRGHFLAVWNAAGILANPRVLD